MKMTTFILLIVCMNVSARTDAQTVTLSLQQAPLEKVFSEIKKQTGYSFVYNNSLMEKASKVTVNVKGASLEYVLVKCFENQPLSYTIIEKTIVVKPKPLNLNEKANPQINDLPTLIEVRGRVLNENGEPVPGATVTEKGTKNATATDQDGRFKLNVEGESARVTITSVGLAPITILVRRNSLSVESQNEIVEGKTDDNARSTASMDPNGVISVKLVRLIREEDAIVITGIVNKRKESFTGSAATYSQKELREVGGTNILQSLKTLDPAFNLRENVNFGSDPNRLPDVEIRGKTSLLGTRDELTIDPNQPLFILDGFESSLKAINDLDINLVESITILKDAASTAIYGSKAANGVVVVETMKPKAGKMRVSYTGNYNINAPDLSS
ncbi:MAG TPA: TonB-dependent receptor plug domain-containing protein, partial [Lacibacter sp.]|nr:TonB-dependent receptor plug domain-containing protein [Lacibacter sp.]